ncbi:MAG TPA: DNA methyltransferase, partial [Saprospiraceae bacterium]|nr:DNA methyltransferase [Saprospiraceae bacterium]
VYLTTSEHKSSLVLDYFAGSGTTGHAVINLNREDGGRRKYILVEMGQYFDTVTKPRIQKVVYSADWKDGKPVGRKGSSHAFKYLRLESYEDALNNLQLRRSAEQQQLLDLGGRFAEEYLLHYWLDTESAGSLLSVAAFERPFDYRLRIIREHEALPTRIDLVETFNYLIGLRVESSQRIRGFHVVSGQNLAGERILVIWRNTDEQDNAALDAFFQKQGYNTRDREYDRIYVNGDNNLENLKTGDEQWKVGLIEEEFLRRMFDVQDV